MNSKKLTFVLVLAVILLSTFIVTALIALQSRNTKTNVNSNVTTTPTNIAATGICGYTAAATEGPYYVSGTTELAEQNLNYTNLSGQVLNVSGYVYAGSTEENPIPGAKIEIWQADDSGHYHPEGNGSISKYESSEIALRGFVTADQNGYYSFSTIFPGEYEGRARHIHFRVSGGGKDVITQLIFAKPGDKTPAANDSIARSLDSCQAPAVNESGTNWTSTYNFLLK